MYTEISFDFKGKRALVVGGSRGIGRGVVAALIDAGADVVYASRFPGQVRAEALYVATDLREESQIERLFATLDERGSLDIVVNCAAINAAKKADSISSAEWDEILSVNLRSVFLVCKFAAERMVPRRSGKIVNVSSIAARWRSPVSGVHYVASKSGLIGLSRQLAFELGPYNVHVNVHCPGQTMTEMLESSMSQEAVQNLSQAIPLRRIATIADQVAPILFLCSDGADYMTGSVLDVNGGQL